MQYVERVSALGNLFPKPISFIYLATLLATGCAPITPPPGLPPINLPSSSSSSSMPSGMPSMPSSSSSSSSGPSKSAGSPSTSQGTKASSQTSQGSSGSTTSQPPLGSTGDSSSDENGVFDPLAGEGDTERQDDSNELSWEKTQPTSANQSEWETSNEAPLETSQEPSTENSSATSGSEQTQGERLQSTLEDFDKEILSERQVLQSEEKPASDNPLGDSQQVAIANSAQTNQAEGVPQRDPGGFEVGAQPIPSRKTGTQIPDDIPDARDDDIIARQLREAAMQEKDASLKEKLWEEYRRYKRG